MADLDPQIVDRAVAEATKRAANLDYFFDNLSSPDWIVPLANRGLFAEPPEQVVDEEGYVRAQGWSASRYLARVAAAAPESVLAVIRGIDTDNERVHEDFVSAALAMPITQATELALRESEWITNRDHIYFLLPQRVVDLAARMAKLGEAQIAMQLFRSLFTPSPVPRDEGWGLKRPQARFSDWDYDHLLRRVINGVVPEAPAPALRELVDVLAAAIELMRPDEDDVGRFDASSRIWRVRIADDRERVNDIANSLVSAVRDAARLIRERGLMGDEGLVGILTARPEELFRRIAMDALVHGPEANLHVVRRFVVDPVELADGEPSVEYRQLLAANAGRLPTGDIERLLNVVREGPDVERYRERAARYAEKDVTADDVARYEAWWRAARLKLLADGLDDSWLQEYEALKELVGDAEIPTSFEITAGFVGPTSPVSNDDLAAMSDDEILEFLRSWEGE